MSSIGFVHQIIQIIQIVSCQFTPLIASAPSAEPIPPGRQAEAPSAWRRLRYRRGVSSRATVRPSFAVRFAVPWTDDAVAPAVFAFRQNKVDIRVVDNPFYTCRPNSGSKRCFLERSALWNREEVSAMLIIDWNAALRTLPVLHLNSN